MLKLDGDILINESHIVTAEFEAGILKVTFSVAITISNHTMLSGNQALFTGPEGMNLWRILSKDAQTVRNEPPDEP
jgi:hypothetical protein